MSKHYPVENIDPDNGHDNNPLTYNPAYDRAENRADNTRARILESLRSAESIGATATVRTSITFKVSFES